MTTPYPSLVSADPQIGLIGMTPVHAADGLRSLADIRAGDLVLTHPFRSPPPSRRRGDGECLLGVVSRVDSREAMESVRVKVLNLADGLEDTLTLGVDQPVWTHPGGWRRAADLQPLQAVVLSFNGNALIMEVTRVAGPVQLLRLEVVGGHSYYTGRLGTWVADLAELAEPQPLVDRSTLVDLEKLSEPRTLVNIPNYYNAYLDASHQAPAEAPPIAPRVSSQAAVAAMGQILDNLRRKLESRQQRMNSISLASVLVKRPDAVPPESEFGRLWDGQDRLLTEGHVSWAALVQANELLFEPGRVDCPGQVVHSRDAYFDDRPAELRQIGRFVGSLKAERPNDPGLRALGESLAGERDYSTNVPLPPGISARSVLCSTLMFFPKHLPAAMLGGSLFPLLWHPSVPTVMMLPFEFWPIELIILWKDGSL